MIGKGYKKIIVVLVFSTLPACSVVGGLWYERIDQLIANQFLEYASFTKEQEKYVRQAALEFKYWNIKNELPKYKKLISCPSLFFCATLRINENCAYIFYISKYRTKDS